MRNTFINNNYKFRFVYFVTMFTKKKNNINDTKMIINGISLENEK